MRFDINLASQPYQDVQRFLMRWGVIVCVAALLTAGLVYNAASAIRSWRSTEREVHSLQQKIAERDHQKAEAQAFLSRPENRATRDCANFLNFLFARKAFSWTQVFVDLEKLMPSQLHVTAIRPAVNDQNELELHLTVSGVRRDSAIELVRRLEYSPHFSHPEILTESTTDPHSGQSGAVQFEIRAVYIPNFNRTQTEASNLAEPPNSGASGAGSSKREGPVEARNAQR